MALHTTKHDPTDETHEAHTLVFSVTWEGPVTQDTADELQALIATWAGVERVSVSFGRPRRTRRRVSGTDAHGRTVLAPAAGPAQFADGVWPRNHDSRRR